MGWWCATRTLSPGSPARALASAPGQLGRRSVRRRVGVLSSRPRSGLAAQSRYGCRTRQGLAPTRNKKRATKDRTHGPERNPVLPSQLGTTSSGECGRQLWRSCQVRTTRSTECMRLSTASCCAPEYPPPARLTTVARRTGNDAARRCPVQAVQNHACPTLVLSIPIPPITAHVRPPVPTPRPPAIALPVHLEGVGRGARGGDEGVGSAGWESSWLASWAIRGDCG